MNREAKLWIVAERPVRLPNALIAAQSLRYRFPGGCHFIRDNSAAWERLEWKRYARYFDDVQIFSQVKMCRGLRDLPRLYHQIRQRKIDIEALPIDPKTDVLLCIAGVMGLANVAASTHPKVYKVLSISASSYERLTRPVDRSRHRFTTSGWLQNRIVEPLAGVERSLNLKPREDPGGDGVRLVRLQKSPDDIFDAVVISSISGTELPPRAEASFVAARYPAIAELPEFARPRSSTGGPMRVVFFGTPFLFVRNLAPDAYLEKANRCFDYLRKNYPGRELIYRPHPFETNEAERLDLNGFRIESDGQPAEVYFLECFREIEAVYSISSTVSRRALTAGLNAYAFWRTFYFPETAARFFEKLMGAVPPEFEIRDLSAPPVAYQSNRSIDPGTRSFGEALEAAIDLRRVAAESR